MGTFLPVLHFLSISVTQKLVQKRASTFAKMTKIDFFQWWGWEWRNSKNSCLSKCHCVYRAWSSFHLWGPAVTLMIKSCESLSCSVVRAGKLIFWKQKESTWIILCSWCILRNWHFKSSDYHLCGRILR